METSSNIQQIQERLKPYFLPYLSPQELETRSHPTKKEKELIETIKNQVNEGLNTGISPIKYQEKQTSQEKNPYKDLIFVTTLYTQYQREKQKEEGKTEDFFLYDEQILALVRLIEAYRENKGLIAEMKTGEGKSQVVIPVFLAWLGLREKDIHIHEINPFLLNEAFSQFRAFADYLGIYSQVGMLDLSKLEEVKEKRFIFGLWHDFIHWYQFSFLRQSPTAFSTNPCLVLDEIDQMLKDESLTPAIISLEMPIDDYLKEYLAKLKADLEKMEEAKFIFEHQGIKVEVGSSEFNEDLTKEGFLLAIKNILNFQDIQEYLTHLRQEGLSEEGLKERLIRAIDQLILRGLVATKLKEQKPDIVFGKDFDKSFNKSFDNQKPYFWFQDPEILNTLATVLIMEEGKDYLIDKNNKIKPLARATGYQEKGKEFDPLINLFLYLKHNLDLPEKVQLETDRLSTFEFYLRFNQRIYGFTGTASPIARRLYEGYELETKIIPSYYPDNRKPTDYKFFEDSEGKIEAIIGFIKNPSDPRNTLVVVEDFDEAKELQKKLNQEENFEIKFLSAENEEEDQLLYQWISQKGEKRRILITVKMIGRGVDLRPDDQVKKEGFLLLTGSPFEYKRSLLQLQGRVGRRGEKGEVVVFIDANDPVFSSLSDEAKKKLKKIFTNPEKNKERLLEFLETAWQKNEDKITERMRGQRILFWPITILREYVKDASKSFSFIQDRWLKKWRSEWGKIWIDKETNQFLEGASTPLPYAVESWFKKWISDNWIDVLDYLEDNLKAMALAGALGPFGEVAPHSAVGKFFNESLKDFFDEFIENMLKQESILI